MEQGIRYVDLYDETGRIYFEFKSVKKVPPGKFNDQFLKDLTNAESIEQIKWYFDRAKISSLAKADFVNQLEKVKDILFSGKSRTLFEDFFGESFDEADDLINMLRSNDAWFNTIFNIK